MPRAGLAGLPTDPAARVPIVPTAIPSTRPRRCLVAPSNARGRRGGVSSGHGWAGGAGLCRGRHRCCRGRFQGWDRFCQLRSRRWHHGWSHRRGQRHGGPPWTGSPATCSDAAGASWTSSPRRRHPIPRLLGPTGAAGRRCGRNARDGDDGDGDDDRGRRDRCDPHQDAVSQACAGEPRRPRAGPRAGAHGIRRGHGLHSRPAGDRSTIPSTRSISSRRPPTASVGRSSTPCWPRRRLIARPTAACSHRRGQTDPAPAPTHTCSRARIEFHPTQILHRHHPHL